MSAPVTATATATTAYEGRLCNQIIRNVCTSLVAERFDLKVEYSSLDRIRDRLGIPLFAEGSKTFDTAVALTDDNFLPLLLTRHERLEANLMPNAHYFQTREISLHLYHHFFQSARVQAALQRHAPFFDGAVPRDPETLDVFVHARLGDARAFNPGARYFARALADAFDDEVRTRARLFLASDDFADPLLLEIAAALAAAAAERGVAAEILLLDRLDEVQTLQFARTCEVLLLSHGSFSAMAGFLADPAVTRAVFFAGYTGAPRWCGDLFCIPGWRCVGLGELG